MAAAAAAMAIAAPALAETGTGAESGEEAARLFGARQSVEYLSLSPSGTKIAYIAPHRDSGEILYVVDLEGDPMPRAIASNSEPKLDLHRCDWATDDRLVCRFYGIAERTEALVGFTRMIAIGADGSDVDLLSRSNSWRALGPRQDGGTILALDVEGSEDKILMTRQWVEESGADTRLANRDGGLGVEEVDIHTQSRRRVERPDDGAARYIADENGRVRIKVRRPLDSLGRMAESASYYYRTRDSDSWERLDPPTDGDDFFAEFYPVAVDTAKDVVYGFGEVDGYDAVFTVALDGSGRREKVLGRSDVDVDQLITIGRRNRVVGASYATEKREVVYFDPELAALARSLSAALPGEPLIDIIDANADESKLMIVASSDVDPGMSYLLDRATGQLNPILPLREQLDGRTMATMSHVRFPAADGTMIPGYLTMPVGAEDGRDLPAVVLPHGGPGARDEWGFDWIVQFLAARGYAVLQPNFRGSAGYGSAWFGRNGFQAWETAVGDVNDAGRWLVAEGIADPDRLAIAGWSYGGYAALQSQVLDPALYKAVVAIAPVTDLDQLREESRAFTNYGIVDAFIGNGPHVRAGSPALNAERFAAPVLLFHGTLDQNVGVRQSRRMADRLEDAGKTVTYIEFDDLAHSLVASSARQRMLREIDAFLAASLER